MNYDALISLGLGSVGVARGLRYVSASRNSYAGMGTHSKLGATL